MNDYIALFSDWSLSSLFIGSGVFVFIYFIQELLFLIFHKKKIFHSLLIPRALRIFFRFELLSVFLLIIERTEAPLFPWDLIYRSCIYILAGCGIMVPLLVLIGEGSVIRRDEGASGKLVPALIGAIGKSLKRSIILITLAVILWGILDFIPEELKDFHWFGAIVVFNGFLISLIIIIVLQKSLRSSVLLSEENLKEKGLIILIKALNIPLLLLVPIMTVIWLNSIYGNNSQVNSILTKSLYLLILAAFYSFVYKLVEMIGLKLSHFSEDDSNALDKTLIEMMRMIIRIALIFFGIFSAIQIITGKPLTSVLAGLGIGGLALALAAQDTLKNFFGSLMIMADKPFKIGQRVVVKGYDGTIEEIGFRSTRIRTLAGHLVVIPNDQMASSSIENIGKRPYIRRLTNITLTYSTTPEKMERALDILRDILDNHEGMPEDFPPRVYFNEYNADSLNILVIYWYSPPDYWKFMQFTEKINLEIMERFNREGIEFAFPTNTTYLEQNDGKSIRLEMSQREIDDYQK